MKSVVNLMTATIIEPTMLDRNWQDETSKPHSQAFSIIITDNSEGFNSY